MRMIKSYIEGVVISVSDVSFKATDGKMVDYFKNWVKTSDGAIITFPSTKNYKEFVDSDAVIELSVQEETEGRKTRYKLRIEDVRRA